MAQQQELNLLRLNQFALNYGHSLAQLIVSEGRRLMQERGGDLPLTQEVQAEVLSAALSKLESGPQIDWETVQASLDDIRAGRVLPVEDLIHEFSGHDHGGGADQAHCDGTAL